MFLFYFFVILTVESVLFSIPNVTTSAATTQRDLTAECYKLYCPLYGGPTCFMNSLQRCIGHAVTLPASTTTTTTIKTTSVKTTTKSTTKTDASTVKAATTSKHSSTATARNAGTSATTKLTTKAGVTTVKAATTVKPSSTATAKNATTPKLTTKTMTTATTTFNDMWCSYCQFGTFCTKEYALRCEETTKASISTVKTTTASKGTSGGGTALTTKSATTKQTTSLNLTSDTSENTTATTHETTNTSTVHGSTLKLTTETTMADSQVTTSQTISDGTASTITTTESENPNSSPTIDRTTEPPAISTTMPANAHSGADTTFYSLPTLATEADLNVTVKQTSTTFYGTSTKLQTDVTETAKSTEASYKPEATTTGILFVTQKEFYLTTEPATVVNNETSASNDLEFDTSSSPTMYSNITTEADLQTIPGFNLEETDLTTRTPLEQSSINFQTSSSDKTTVDNEISPSVQPSTESTPNETIETSTKTSVPPSTTTISIPEVTASTETNETSTMTITTLKTDSRVEETESTSPSTVIPTAKTTFDPTLTTKEVTVTESEETTTTKYSTTTASTTTQQDVTSETSVPPTNAQIRITEALTATGASCNEFATSQSISNYTTSAPTTQQEYRTASSETITTNVQNGIIEAIIATGASCDNFQTSLSITNDTTTVPTTEQNDWTASSETIVTITNAQSGLIEAFVATGASCDEFQTSQATMPGTTTVLTTKEHDSTVSPEATGTINNAQIRVTELIATGANCADTSTSQSIITKTTTVESSTTSTPSLTNGQLSSTSSTPSEPEQTTTEAEKFLTTHKATTTVAVDISTTLDITNPSLVQQMTTIESVNDVETTTHATTGNNAPTTNWFTMLATTVKPTSHVTSQTSTGTKTTHLTTKILTTQNQKSEPKTTTHTITTKASIANATHGSSSSIRSSTKLKTTTVTSKILSSTERLKFNTTMIPNAATTGPTKMTTVPKLTSTKGITTTSTKPTSTTTETIPESTTTPCKCSNSGTCDKNGQCVCADGYFGSNCDSNMPSSSVAAATAVATVFMAASQSSSSSVKFLWPRYTATTRMPTNPHEFFRLLSTYWLTVALGVNSMFGVPASMDIKNLPKCSMAYLFGTGAFFFSLTAMIFEAGVDALTLAGLRNNAWIRPAERRPRCFPFWFTFSLYCLVGVAPIAIMWLRHWTDCVTPRSCIGSLGYIYGGYDDGIQNASWLQLTMTVGYTFIAVFLGILAILCNKFDVCRCRRRTEAWSINPYIYGREIWPLEANAYLCLVAIQPILFMMVWISSIYVNDMKTTKAQWLNFMMTCIYSVSSTIQTSLTTSQQLSNTVEFFMTAIPERFLHYMPSMNHATLNDKVDIVKAHMLSDHWQKFQSRYETADRKLARFDKIPFGLEEYMYRLWLLDYIRIRDSGKTSEAALLIMAKTFLDQKYDLRIISTFHFAQLFGIWSAYIKETDSGKMDGAMIKKSRQILDREMDLSQPPPKVVVNECGIVVTYRKRMPHLAPIYYTSEDLDTDNTSAMENGKVKSDMLKTDNNPTIVPRNLVQVYRRDFPASS